MYRIVKLPLLTLVLTVAPVALGVAWAAEEPIDELTRRLRDAQPDVRRQAAEALAAQGAAARSSLKALRQALADQEPEVRVAAARAVWLVGGDADEVVPVLIEVLKLADSVAGRAEAADALGEIGPAAKEAIPLLFIETFKPIKGETINYAVPAADRALPRIVPDVVPLLISAFAWDRYPVPTFGGETTDEASRSALYAALVRRLCLAGKSAIPQLVEALSHDNARIRLGAAQTLCAMGPEAEAAQGSLIETTKDADPLVRVHAAIALFAVSQETPIAVPVLAAALGDPDAEVRRQAAEGLGAIGPGAQAALPALVAGLSDEAHFAAAIALAQVGQAAVPELIAALSRDNARVRQAAGVALSQTRCDAAAAVPSLGAALGDSSAAVRAAAAQALGHIGPAAAPAAPLLAAALKEGRLELDVAADALGGIGPHARDAAQALLEAVEREGARPSLASAARALAAIDRELAVSAVPVLVGKLQQPSSRDEALDALAELGELAAPAVPALAELLTAQPTGDEQLLPVAVLRVLSEIGPAAKEAVPALMEVVERHENDYLRAEAAELLGRLGRDAAQAMGALKKALQAEDPRLRREAQRAIGLITAGETSEP